MVYPANISMAVDATPPQSVEDRASWARLPLQIPLFAWAFRHARQWGRPIGRRPGTPMDRWTFSLVTKPFPLRQT